MAASARGMLGRASLGPTYGSTSAKHSALDWRYVMKPWTVTASSHVLEDRWIRVRADDCVTANGHVIKPFYVLDYPDWVNVVAITRDQKIILVRQYRHGLGAITLGLPAGVLEKSESDPVAGGARELLEETGYRSDDMKLVATVSPNAATHSNRLHVVVARNAYCAQEPPKDPTEEIEVNVLTISDALAQAFSGGIMQATQIAALMLGLTATKLLVVTEQQPMGSY
jgi:8-oxo-dGDP phosphatase